MTLRLIDNEKINENEVYARKYIYWVACSIGMTFAMVGLTGVVLNGDGTWILWRLATATAIMVLLVAFLVLAVETKWFIGDRRDLALDDTGTTVNEETRLPAAQVQAMPI